MRIINKKFKYKHKILLTVKSGKCENCFFYNGEVCGNPRFHCLDSERKDKTSVNFVLCVFKYGK